MVQVSHLGGEFAAGEQGAERGAGQIREHINGPERDEDSQRTPRVVLSTLLHWVVGTQRPQEAEAFCVLDGSCRSLASLWYPKEESSCTVHWLFLLAPTGPCWGDTLL